MLNFGALFWAMLLSPFLWMPILVFIYTRISGNNILKATIATIILSARNISKGIYKSSDIVFLLLADLFFSALILLLISLFGLAGPPILTVESNANWKYALAKPKSFSLVYIEYVSGSWTVDQTQYNYVGIYGYDNYIDGQIWEPEVCKELSNAPYGALLGKINDEEPFIVKPGFKFISKGGKLSFKINDKYDCQWDNAGAVRVRVLFQ